MATATDDQQLTDGEIDEALSGLNDKDQEKLGRFTKQAISRSGISGIRDQSPTYERFRRQVIDDIYGAGQTLREIEEAED